MKIRILSFIGTGLIALLIFATAFVQSNRTAWEYKVLAVSWDEKDLNTLGGDGWELVAVDASRGDYSRAFFKRRK
ncbi:MAG: hypothetical protein JWM21_2601 [Acidobacteria bacterium]|nr:hypothetical protein [Acidobacteriota bacterium]